MSKKRLTPPSDYDIINNILDRDTFTNTKGVTAYNGLDNYYLTKDYAEKAYNVDKYAVDDLKNSNTYYDKDGNPQSSNKLDNSSWYSNLIGEDVDNKLLRISEDIIYPDGSTASERETKKALSQGLSPEFANEVGYSNAKSLAKEANSRNGAIFDVLGVIGLGGLSRSISSSLIEEQKLIPYFHPTLKKWVSKVATQEDFDAGAAAMSAYGPRSDNENFLTAFNKGFSNGMASLPKTVARFNEWVGDLGEAGINWSSGEGFKADYGYADKLADRLNKGYERAEQSLAPNAQDTLGSFEGLANGIGQGLSSLLQYAVTGGVTTGFGTLTGSTAAKLIGQGGVNALSKAGMLTAGFALNGGEAYDSAKKAGLSEEDAALMALAVGSINTAIELKVGANKLQEYLVGARGAKEIPRIILEETGGDLSKLNKVTGSILERVNKSFDDLTKIPILGTALEEGSEEFMQSLVNSTSQMMYNQFIANSEATEGKGAYESKNLTDVFKDAFSEAVIGALVGGIAGIATKNDIAEKESIMPFIAQGKSDLVLSSLQELADKGEITPETFDNYYSRISQLDTIWNTNKSVFEGLSKINDIESDVVKASALSLIDKEFELKEKSKSLRQDINDIKLNPELADSIKDEKIKQIEAVLESNNSKIREVSSKIADLIPDENGNIQAESKYNIFQNIKDYVIKKGNTIVSTINEQEASVLFDYNSNKELIDNILTTASKTGLTPEIKKQIDVIIGLDNVDTFIDKVISVRQQITKSKKAEKVLKAQLEEIAKKEEEEKRKSNIETIKEKVKKNKKENSDIPPPSLEDAPEALTTSGNTESNTIEDIERRRKEELNVDGKLVYETGKDRNGNSFNSWIEHEEYVNAKYDAEIKALLDKSSALGTNEQEKEIVKLDTEEVSVIAIEKGKEVKANRELAIIEDGLVRNITEEQRLKLGNLRAQNNDTKRIIGNSIAYLGIDKIVLGRIKDGVVESKTFNTFDENDNVEVNKFVDVRLFSQNQFIPGDYVSLTVPTFEEMEQRGLQDYNISDYATTKENVEEFVIAVRDSDNKIIGYLPTQSGIKRLVSEEFLKEALDQNLEIRNTIFEDRESTYETSIVEKTPGWLILDKISNQKSLYTALGDGNRLADKVTLAVGKLDRLYVNTRGTYQNKVINNEHIENGVVYSVVPSSKKDEYIAYPMDTNPIGRNNSDALVEAIKLFAKYGEGIATEKEKQSIINISQDYNLSNFDDLNKFINNIMYGTANAEAKDEYIFKFYKGSLHLSKTDPNMVFSMDEIANSQQAREDISDILASRFHSIKLDSLNSKEPYIHYVLKEGVLTEKEYKTYQDYLNESGALTSNIRGLKIEDNEYAFTAQTVIGLSNLVLQVVQQVIEEKPTDITTEEIRPPKKTRKTLGLDPNKFKGKKPELDINPEYIQRSNIKSGEDLMKKCL